MPKTRQQKKKRNLEGFEREYENLSVYLEDLHEELEELYQTAQMMQPFTEEQQKRKQKVLAILGKVQYQLATLN